MTDIKMLPLPKWLLEGFTDPTIEKLTVYARAVAEHLTRSLTHELANAECALDAERAERKKAVAVIEALQSITREYQKQLVHAEARAQELQAEVRRQKGQIKRMAREEYDMIQRHKDTEARAEFYRTERNKNQRKAERLEEAIRAYKSECDNPAKDYVLRAKRRDEMFALLRNHNKEKDDGRPD